MSVNTPSAMKNAQERTREAEQAVAFAIGALEMAAQKQQELLGGYSGATATRYLREAHKLVTKAKALLDALPQ